MIIDDNLKVHTHLYAQVHMDTTYTQKHFDALPPSLLVLKGNQCKPHQCLLFQDVPQLSSSKLVDESMVDTLQHITCCHFYKLLQVTDPYVVELLYIHASLYHGTLLTPFCITINSS